MYIYTRTHTHTHTHTYTEDTQGNTAVHLVCRSRNNRCVQLVALAAAREMGAPEVGGGRGGGDTKLAGNIAGLESRVTGSTPLHHAVEAGGVSGSVVCGVCAWVRGGRCVSAWVRGCVGDGRVAFWDGGWMLRIGCSVLLDFLPDYTI